MLDRDAAILDEVIRVESRPVRGIELEPEDRHACVTGPDGHEGIDACAEQRGQAHRPAASRRHGLSALSGRERQIAELVSYGHTNRQIARKLSLSEKTIETHLSRIFVKLGVSSRAAVASTVARAGYASSSVA